MEDTEENKDSTILWHSREIIFANGNGKLQEIPFCSQVIFAWKTTSILWPSREVFFAEWNLTAPQSQGVITWKAATILWHSRKTVFPRGTATNSVQSGTLLGDNIM
jgi:hypothetical protein